MTSRGGIEARVARRRLWFTALCVALSLAVAPNTRAQAPPPAERAQLYSAYEQETIDEVLRALRAVRDLNPEGKIIERIDGVPLDVFEPRDPVPLSLKSFQAPTRRTVVRRETLLSEHT